MRGVEVYMEAKLGGELYEVTMKIIHSQDRIIAAVKRESSAADLPMWHRHLGHLGDSILKKLIDSNIVKEMEVTNSKLEGICEDCIMGKMDEKPFNARSDRDSQIFGTMHADLVGPMSPEARWSHAKFSLIINDNCSGFSFAFNLRYKDETAKIFMELDKAIETKFQKRIHTLRTDNGGEFTGQEMREYCRGRGISQITSVAYNPEQNG